ncbi:MAG: sigma 54-interacting transcriptional regulator [Thermoanaerobaculaceae bacterium]|nr:sigma 54-interacting transcriptional regulator [Thermoanaerobaculaceae bacterium]
MARTVYRLSRRVWGAEGGLALVGRSEHLAELLERVAKAAPFPEPVLLLGESGTGKELLAKALYLLSPQRSGPFIPVNCPQFQDGNLMVSELFGHRRGSFTGAVADRRGAFELADGGVIFLDEVADLHASAQVLLLRALATGEFQALGDSRMRKANVRVVAATNRPLEALRFGDRFREDLYFRLRFFRLWVPPLRERGDDWRDLVEFLLYCLERRHGVTKTLSQEAWDVLARHPWPGNVRELGSVVTMGYAMAEGTVIRPEHFVELLGEESFVGKRREDEVLRELLVRGDFWRLVHDAFLDRELNRAQVQHIIRSGLAKAGGSYKRLLALLGLPASDYQRFMDFLRHHRLKPS